MSKTVRYKRDESQSKQSKKAKKQKPVYRKGDLRVMEYCKEHPLDALADGVEVHQLFFAKGEEIPDDLKRLFSGTIPEKGYTTLKSILYGHVTQPCHNGQRREMFVHHSDEAIMRLKDEIIDLVDDPFWKEIEKGQKFGSYAWHGYKTLVPHIVKQYAGANDDHVPDWLQVGIQRVVDELPDDLTPISLEEAAASCRMDTNSGFPAFTSKPFMKMNDDGESYTVLNEEMYDLYMTLAKSVLKGEAHTNLPGVLFKRIQPGNGTDSKTRIVECISRAILWAEATFYRPLLENMRTRDRYAGYRHWADNEYPAHNTQQVIDAILEADHAASLDYTAYDSTIGKIIPLVLEALAVKYPIAEKLLLWSAEYYRTCPLLTPHGWIQGKHGLFSGMFGTSLLGSLVNSAIVEGVEYAINVQQVLGPTKTFTPVGHLGFGDDTAYGWNGDVGIDELVDIITSAGLEMNVDKQEYCGPDAEHKFIMFQACYWRLNNGTNDLPIPVYPLVRCAARLAFFENIDKHTKTIYAAGYRVEDVANPTEVGAIICGLIAKLMEAVHHPSINEFIIRYQESWCHYLNPLYCVTDDAISFFENCEFAYISEETRASFLDHEVVKALLDNLTACTETCRIEDPAIVSLERVGNHKESSLEDNVYEEFDEETANSALLAIMRMN